MPLPRICKNRISTTLAIRLRSGDSLRLSEYLSNLAGLGLMPPREGSRVIMLMSGIFPRNATSTHIEKASAVVMSSQMCEP